MKKTNSSRRDFLKKTALGASLFSFLSSSKTISHPLPKPIHLNMVGYDYPRVKAFFEKKVEIEGCTFDIEKSSIGTMNTNVFSGKQPHNISEIGLVPFIIAYANNGFRDYTLLPIFPLRMFRHKSIFIHADSGIKTAEDLKGKKIGTPGYSSSSLTWIRGALQDEYNVKPEDIQWVIAQKDSSADLAGKTSEQEQVLPKNISITLGTKGKDESELLLSREVDALFHAIEPKAYLEGNPKVIRLFQDSRQTEQAYFQKTGVFPIMHAVAIKKALLEERPQLSKSIFEAYSKAKSINYQYMRKLGWVYDSLPWYGQEYEETRKLMGDNFWSYGIKDNRKTLDTICRYCFEQGLIKQKVRVEDLFYANTFELKEK